MYFEGIRKKIGSYLLKQESSAIKRKKQAFNLNEAKSFAIVFEASKMEDVELVKKYVNYLKELKKKVRIIGYFNSEHQPNFTYSKLEYEFFATDKLNWYLKPGGSFITDFINEEFDVLIDLNINDYFPLKYVSTLSKAKFKVGKFTEDNKSIFDLLIENDKANGFKYFLRQVDIYLSMINKPQA